VRLALEMVSGFFARPAERKRTFFVTVFSKRELRICQIKGFLNANTEKTKMRIISTPNYLSQNKKRNQWNEFFVNDKNEELLNFLCLTLKIRSFNSSS